MDGTEITWPVSRAQAANHPVPWWVVVWDNGQLPGATPNTFGLQMVPGHTVGPAAAHRRAAVSMLEMTVGT